MSTSGSIWVELADTANTESHTETNTGPVWYWLPGWGFKPTVFNAFYRQLPGAHLGLDYSALFRQLTPETTDEQPHFERALEIIHQSLTVISGSNSTVSTHLIGWSLGGAFAAALGSLLLEQNQHQNQTQNQHLNPRIAVTSVTTLASGARFLAASETSESGSEYGMQAPTFDAFCSGFDRFPAKTLKRFLALCCQGADDSRALISQLSEHQIAADETDLLATSLQWLTQYQLNAHLDGHAFYGADDALNPGGLEPASIMGKSHAFLLEPDAQTNILKHLKTLSGVAQA